jgi:long-subunit fatty acid transport protein
MNCFGNSIRFAAIKMRCLKQTTHFRRNICFLGNRTFSITRFCSGILAVLFFAVFDSHTAHGGSFALNEQSVSGLGTAYAGGAAQAGDASTIFFNPAGIALLDQGEFQLGGQLIVPRATFTNEGSRYNLPDTPVNGLRLSGGNGGDGGVDHVLPNIYLSQPVFRSPQYGDLTVGVGLSVPFGLETDYSPGWVGRYTALRTKLTTFDIQPTIAYRLFDRISFGASLDIQYASARLTQAIDFGLAGAELTGQFEQALPALLAARGVPAAAIPSLVAATQQAYNNAGFVPGGRDGISEVTGDNWRVGFTLGAIFEYWKGNEQSFFQDGRFGASYRSGISHTLTGNASFRDVPAITAAGAPVQFPQPNAFQDIFFDQNATAQLDLPEIYHFSPTVDFTDSQGHELRGKFDSAVDIVSAAVTFRWGGPGEAAHAAPQLPGKEPVAYSK